jgi:hypothetical protein
MVSCDSGGIVLRAAVNTEWSVDDDIFDTGYTGGIYVGDLVLAGDFGSHCACGLPCGSRTNVLSGGNSVGIMVSSGDLGGAAGHSVDA